MLKSRDLLSCVVCLSRSVYRKLKTLRVKIPLAVISFLILLNPLHAQDGSSFKRNSFAITKEATNGEERYSITVERENIASIIDALFLEAEREYSLLTKANVQVESLSYKNKSFEDLLTLILEQANLTYSINKNIFYIYETTRNEIIRKYMEDSSYVIKLKYIKSNELVKSLPPYLKKDNVIETLDDSLVFFTGNKTQLEKFQNDLSVIDVPKKQIKYQLLVIQRQKTRSLNYGTQFGISKADEKATSGFSTMLSNIFNINFDIISKFGLQFAGSLNAELGEGVSKVLADTTLNGISGEDVNFSNTNTYRYRDIIVDSKGDIYSSTTREIASGLTLTVNGWASGDNMITVKIAATVSKQGSTSGSSSGSKNTMDTSSPPSTSEKRVSTNVRTKSGEPVIIGGLFQMEEDVNEKKVPLVGDVPVLGNLFKSKNKTKADTEFVIYLIPFLQVDESQVLSEEENYLRIKKKYGE